MRWLPYGPQALLVYFADSVGEEAFRRGRALVAALERRPPVGLQEYVISFTSLLLEFHPDVVINGEVIVAELAEAADAAPVPASAPRVIRVRYDGPDLGRVADHAGLNEQEVIAIHSGSVYRVYSLGFAPGFPYLGDLDRRLWVPRLPTPRAQVPSGSVAIGGEHTGIYPVASPGGWNLIGRTRSRLFVPEAPDVAKFLLRPGDLVRFVPE